MKAILEFNLDDIDDEIRHRKCLFGQDAMLVLCDLMEAFRETVKYSDKEIDRDHAERWRKILQELMDNRNITTDLLYM